MVGRHCRIGVVAVLGFGREGVVGVVALGAIAASVRIAIKLDVVRAFQRRGREQTAVGRDRVERDATQIALGGFLDSDQVFALGVGIVEKNQFGITALCGEFGLLLAIDPDIQVVTTRVAQFDRQIAAAETDIDIDSAPIERDRAVAVGCRATQHARGRVGYGCGCQCGLCDRFRFGFWTLAAAKQRA